MRIGVFSQWYDPEPGPASLPGVYARALTARGHPVRVLTGFPNYPDGRLYSGYRGRWSMSEVRNGIPVHRVPLYPHHGSSALGRVANYTSFALSASLLGSRDFASVDAMWVYNSPATVGLPLMFHSRLRRTPYLLHVQDLWPDSVVNSGMLPSGAVGRVIEATLGILVRRTECAAAEIAVVSPSVRGLLIDHGVPDTKISYVPNPTDETLFYPRARTSELRKELLSGAPPETVVVMYAGSFGHVQALENAVDAMSQLRHQPVRLVLAGSGIAEPELRALVSTLGLTTVGFLGRHPPGSIPGLMAAADVQLVSLRADPFLAATTPSKLAAIMASAQPVVAAMSGDGADLVRRSGAGVVCQPGDSTALAEAISELVQSSAEERAMLGLSGREFYLKNMSVQGTAKTVETILSRIANTS